MEPVYWNRKELKSRSKEVLRQCYWRMVLVAILIAFFWGGGQAVTGLSEPILDQINSLCSDTSDGVTVTFAEDQDVELSRRLIHPTFYQVEKTALQVTKAIAITFLTLMFAVVMILLNLFVLDPLHVGFMRLFQLSFEKRPKFKELFYAFEGNYRNVVSVMFFKRLLILLWTFLFIIPGIVKIYEYSMVPYLLAEDSSMETKTALELSRNMMRGHKWKAFVLDLSFVGWYLLNMLTFGILNLFYVTPYRNLTKAALYRRLRGKDGMQNNIYYEGMPLQTERLENE